MLPKSNLKVADPSQTMAASVLQRLRGKAQQSSYSPIKLLATKAAEADLSTTSLETTSLETTANLVEQLTREVRQLETVSRRESHKSIVSSGSSALDDCLPENGYAPGSVIEYLRAMPGSGVSTLVFAAASAAMRASGGFVVVVDTQHNIYPPALASAGLDLEKMVLVRPQSDVDALWAIDQSLRTSAVAAVISDVERIDDRSARRMQLAAEQGGGIALLMRPAAARRAPSWAEVQWLVRALPTPQAELASDQRHLQVQLVRLRGGASGATVRLKIDGRDGTLREIKRHEQTGALHLASQLANPTRPSRRAATG